MKLRTAVVAAPLLAVAVLSPGAVSHLRGQETASGERLPTRLPPLPPRDVRVVNAEAEAIPVRAAEALAVSVAGTPSVQVTNTVASPIPVWNASPPALQPWHQSFVLDLAEGVASLQATLDIPPGKRLVLEHVSASLIVLPQQTPVLIFFGDNPSAAGVPHTLHVENVGPWGNSIQSRWTASHAMRAYLDSALLRLSRAGSTSGPLFASVAFSGSLVDIP
jgi:hypothetical protein